jgi:hypothetical protein
MANAGWLARSCAVVYTFWRGSYAEHKEVIHEKTLLQRLQAAFAAHDTAVEKIRDTEEQRAAARAALDEELRAKDDAADIIDTMSGDERQAHIWRMERAMADAYANRHDAPGYFLDKRGARAGTTDAPAGVDSRPQLIDSNTFQALAVAGAFLCL